MADNPYVNKVEYAGQTIMDITDSTAEESDVLENKVFYKSSGQRSVGTLGDFTGATSLQAGTHGLVPAPSIGDQAKFLKGDGTWYAPVKVFDWGCSVDDVFEAYAENTILYCRVYWPNEPQVWIGQLSYVDDKDNPTALVFEYYHFKRADTVSDRIYFFTVRKNGGWQSTVQNIWPKNTQTYFSNKQVSVNSSGLINLEDNFGSTLVNNCRSISIKSRTSQICVSNPVLWGNGNWYVSVYNQVTFALVQSTTINVDALFLSDPA